MSIPGLPSLSSGAANLFVTQLVLLTADAILGLLGFQQQWGIFSNGAPVVEADNVVSFDFRQDFSISNYPVEQGSFASYNKVQHPQEMKFRFSTGGSNASRQAFINSIQAVIADTNLYDVVTPDAAYTNLNFTHWDYSRSADRGNGLLVIDVWCEEVRPASLATSTTTAAAATTGTTGNSTGGGQSNVTITSLSNAQNPAATPQVNGGNVQPQAPTAAQQSAATAAINQSTPFF